LPIRVNTKYYLPILFLFFSIITDEIRLDILIGAGVGYLDHSFLNEFFNHIFTATKLSMWESGAMMTWIKTLPG
jgi:hypothetical protein